MKGPIIGRSKLGRATTGNCEWRSNFWREVNTYNKSRTSYIGIWNELDDYKRMEGLIVGHRKVEGWPVTGNCV